MAEVFDIYTDGSCNNWGNQRGGWAYIILQHGREIARASGPMDLTTSNRMEMQAAINALSAVPPGSIVMVYSDSQYLVKGANIWAKGWERRGWKLGNNGPVKNLDLWHQLMSLKNARQCRFQWVKGHAGDKWNCECDRMANEQSGLTEKAAETVNSEM